MQCMIESVVNPQNIFLDPDIDLEFCQDNVTIADCLHFDTSSKNLRKGTPSSSDERFNWGLVQSNRDMVRLSKKRLR